MSLPAFIFDLDGVITDTAAYHFQAWKRMAESEGMTFTEADNERLKGIDRRRSLELILMHSGKTYTETDKQRLMEQKNADYLALIDTMSPADLLPGAHELLTELRDRGYKIGLASASRNAPAVVRNLSIAGLFDYIADAGAIPNGKPAPDIFLDVMHAFEMTPETCIGIEDAAAGVQSIKSAGMFAVGIGDAEILAQADIVYPAIGEVVIDELLDAIT